MDKKEKRVKGEGTPDEYKRNIIFNVRLSQSDVSKMLDLIWLQGFTNPGCYIRVLLLAIESADSSKRVKYEPCTETMAITVSKSDKRKIYNKIKEFNFRGVSDFVKYALHNHKMVVTNA